MDNTKTTTHVGLCAGYGGIELGLKRVIPNLRSIALCEIEAFACANLVAKMEAGFMDPAPIWTDLKTFPWGAFRDRVDILTGGYPCQPFSAAGLRRGKDDPRHLWPYIADGIRSMRPRLCFFENVEGHISMGLPDVIEDLVGMGYRVAWGIFSASEVGAPHQRKRVFILAHCKDKRLLQFPNIGTIRGEICSAPVSSQLAYRNEQGLERCVQRGITPNQKQNELAARRGCSLADTNSSRGWEDRQPSQSWAISIEQPSCIEGRGNAGEVRERQAWPARPGQQQYAWEPPRVVADSHRINRSASAEGWEHDRQAGSEGETMGDAESGTRFGDAQWEARHLTQSDEAMGDTNRQGSQERSRKRGAGIQGTDADGGADADGEAESSLGGNPDGSASGVDYAELCITCDNRTDELRLLGNGVVVATAEKSFRVLLEKLMGRG